MINSKSFNYKTNITGSTYDVDRERTDAGVNTANNPDYVANKRGTNEVEIAVPLKYLGNFWDTLDMSLINCEVSLALNWSANCVITIMEKRITTGTNRGDSPTNATFKITDTTCIFH